MLILIIINVQGGRPAILRERHNDMKSCQMVLNHYENIQSGYVRFFPRCQPLEIK
jgi:hypothetical protein